MDLAAVYRIFQPTIQSYTFYSEAHRGFSNTHRVLGHKANLLYYFFILLSYDTS